MDSARKAGESVTIMTEKKKSDARSKAAPSAPPPPIAKPVPKAPWPPTTSGKKRSGPTAEDTKEKAPQRWTENSIEEGQWIQLPKVLLQGLSHFVLTFADSRRDRPITHQELWPLLTLQSEKYSNRFPRFYWEELAQFCGASKQSVRRWAYQLRDGGLLEIIPSKSKSPDEQGRVGYRNERNKFKLDEFEARVEQVHLRLAKSRKKKRRKKAG